MVLFVFQSVQDGAEAAGPTCQAAVPSKLPGALGSVWKPASGVSQEPGAPCTSIPGPQRQPDGRRHHPGVAEQLGGAQDGREHLYHCENQAFTASFFKGGFFKSDFFELNNLLKWECPKR